MFELLGNAMNVMTFDVIPPPSREPTDLNYEADLKTALEPFVSELLDRAENAGWDRGKAAYTLMFLAARRLNDGKGPAENGRSTS
ncbi:hypothetical protein [Mesorhizobium waimense]|nr:hypothetical protein [Mesorhizobium waimense]